MKSLLALFASCLLATSNALAQSASAPDTATPGYLFVLGRSTDRAKIMAYSATLPPIYSATGGRYIGLGRPGGGVTCLNGLCDGRSAVIAHWNDHKSVETFWWGDAYRKAVRLRDGAGVFTVVGIKGHAESAPLASTGALLIATFNTSATTTLPVAQTWLDAASSAGGKLLAPFVNAAVTSLEGDALYNRIALLSFPSKANRDAFAASEATQTFVKTAPALTLIALIAIDAPPPAPASASAMPTK